MNLLLPLAWRVGLVDNPGGRKKQHASPTPLIGGLAIYLTLICVTLPMDSGPLGLLIASSILIITGMIDDLYGMRPVTKLSLQTLSTFVLIMTTGVYVSSLGTLSNGLEINLGVSGIFFTLFAIVGVINAINMIDGLDGLAGSSILAILQLAWAMEDMGRPMPTEDLQILAIICGSLIAFLLFNFTQGPRKVFLGDAGSMLLGLYLGFFLVKASQQQPQDSTLPTSLVPWIIALPVLETLTIFMRRLFAGKSPFSPDRNHLHFLLQKMSLGPVSVLLIILGLSNALFWFGIFLSKYSGLLTGLVFCICPGFYFFVTDKILKAK